MSKVEKFSGAAAAAALHCLPNLGSVSYVGPGFPERLLSDPYEDPARAAWLADSVSARMTGGGLAVRSRR